MNRLYCIKTSTNKYVCEKSTGEISFSKVRSIARSFFTKRQALEYVSKKKLTGLTYVIDEWQY